MTPYLQQHHQLTQPLRLPLSQEVQIKQALMAQGKRATFSAFLGSGSNC